MVVHPASHGVSRVPRYSGSSLSVFSFGYGALTLSSRPSHAVLLDTSVLSTVHNPEKLGPSVWPPPRSLATTCGISVDVFSWPYLDVSVQAVPLIRLFHSTHDTGVLLRWVPPIRKSTDLADICSSPWLIAACHVLLRLLMPRHSPCALSSLTVVGSNCARSVAPPLPHANASLVCVRRKRTSQRFALSVPTLSLEIFWFSLELCRQFYGSSSSRNCYPTPFGVLHN